MDIISVKQNIAMVAILGLVLSLGNIAYTSQIVSQMKNTQYQYEELLDDYSQLQEEYENQITGQGQRYTGNPFGTELWPGQLQSENITGMHWYSWNGTGFQNCTDNVLGVDGVELEGDYTTWTLVWKRDYGSDAMIYNILVDNSGTVYSEDNWYDTYLKTYEGAETNLNIYIIFKDDVMVIPMSMTCKYVLGDPIIAQSEFEVFKDGVVVFNHDAKVDEANVKGVFTYTISANGKFIAIVCNNVSFEARYVLLYEGS